MIDFPAKMRIFGRMNTLGINKAPKDTRGMSYVPLKN